MTARWPQKEDPFDVALRELNVEIAKHRAAVGRTAERVDRREKNDAERRTG